LRFECFLSCRARVSIVREPFGDEEKRLESTRTSSHAFLFILHVAFGLNAVVGDAVRGEL